MLSQAGDALHGHERFQVAAMPLLFRTEKLERRQKAGIKLGKRRGLRAAQKAGTIRAFAELELLDGSGDPRFLCRAEEVGIIPRQQCGALLARGKMSEPTVEFHRCTLYYKVLCRQVGHGSA